MVKKMENLYNDSPVKKSISLETIRVQAKIQGNKKFNYITQKRGSQSDPSDLYGLKR